MACFQWQPHTSPKRHSANDCPSMAAIFSNQQGQRLPCKKANEPWNKSKRKRNFLVFSGAVKDGSDTKLVRENTEVTLLKHASASNKHVCEVRSSAPRSQHMFIAPEK